MTSQFKVISSYLNSGEINISQVKELRSVLCDFLKYGNNIVLVEYIDYGVLTIGVGLPYGFVEFMHVDRLPPYLLAINDSNNKAEDSFIEFDSGGTPTPIPIEYCLPFDQVVEIVAYFLRNKKIPDYIRWIKI